MGSFGAALRRVVDQVIGGAVELSWPSFTLGLLRNMAALRLAMPPGAKGMGLFGVDDLIPCLRFGLVLVGGEMASFGILRETANPPASGLRIPIVSLFTCQRTVLRPYVITHKVFRFFEKRGTCVFLA